MQRLKMNAYPVFTKLAPYFTGTASGKVNIKGLEFYDRLVDDLLEKTYHAVYHAVPLGSAVCVCFCAAAG